MRAWQRNNIVGGLETRTLRNQQVNLTKGWCI